MKNVPVIVIALIFVSAVVYYFAMPKPQSVPVPEVPVTTEETTIETPIDTPAAEPSMAETTTKSFDVKGLNYTYDVKEIRVKLNDTVKINFMNTEGTHNLKIDELNVATKVIKTGDSEMVEFVANKAGTFEYYCSVGQHRANGMWGKLIVE